MPNNIHEGEDAAAVKAAAAHQGAEPEAGTLPEEAKVQAWAERDRAMATVPQPCLHPSPNILHPLN